ncbi:MAG: DUF4364 family protein [Clostridia bacterium]|nr:DUF4364 family protein [Clostridia bacterium]
MGALIRDKVKVKIFVLYLMENIKYPLDFITINDIVMQTDYVMYLDFAEAFNEMLDAVLIEKSEEGGVDYYFATEKGRCVAAELKSEVKEGLLDKALEAGLKYLSFKKRGITVRCSVEKNHDGTYQVVCSFTENKNTIFTQSLTVDSLERARKMQENFYERPETVYKGVLALMSGNVNYLFA